MSRLNMSLKALGVVCLMATPAMAEMGDPPFNVYVLADQLEYGFDDGKNPFAWSAMSWMGGDWNRLWIETEGEIATTESEGGGEVSLLYGRLIAPFWELRVGARGQLERAGDETLQRYHFEFGLEGLAPYTFELTPALYVSLDGDVSARFTASYDQRVTQRLIIQPEIELNAAVQEVKAWGVGSGLNDLQFGLRLRYEMVRKFAPYLGADWVERFGATADMAAADREVLVIAGLRVWL